MHYNSRSVYGCGAAPKGMEAPVDCRYTYNAETNRLYLHLFAWPFNTVHLKNMAGRVKYAQFLHDASEVRFREPQAQEHASLSESAVRGDLTLRVPVVKPNIEIPTIELFLK
jgi:alpha-L-fucosidase